jgi:hypothetical protein
MRANVNCDLSLTRMEANKNIRRQLAATPPRTVRGRKPKLASVMFSVWTRSRRCGSQQVVRVLRMTEDAVWIERLLQRLDHFLFHR